MGDASVVKSLGVSDIAKLGAYAAFVFDPTDVKMF